jgi:uncharacterized protein
MTGMQQRVSLITLGVADVPTALAFYRALGWVEHPRASDPGEIAFFQSGGMVVALWDRAKLADDSVVTDGGGWGGVTLAHNVGSPAEVDAILELAASAHARVVRAGAATEWGGYSGVFLDPDGHPWEIAHNPYWPLNDDDGAIDLGR